MNTTHESNHPFKNMFDITLKTACYFIILCIGCHTHAIELNRIRYESIDFSKDMPAKRGYQLLQDQKGDMWISTNKGVYKYDGYGCKDISKIAKSELNLDTRDILEGEEGILWIASTTGLYSYDTQENTITAHPLTPQRIQQPAINCLLYNSEDSLLYCAGRDGGLYIYHTHAHTVRQKKSITNTSQATIITKIKKSPDGKIWFSTWGAGLVSYDKYNNTYNTHQLDIPNQNTSLKIISAIHLSPSGLMYLGSWGQGIYIVDITTRETPIILDTYNTHNSHLSHDIIYDINEDYQRNIWIGNPMGIDILKNPLTNHKKINNIPSISKEVTRIISTNNNLIWLCTKNNGVQKIIINHTPFISTELPQDTYPMGEISSISISPQQEIHVGIYSHFFSTYNEQESNFTNYKQHHNYREIKKKYNTAKDIYWDPYGTQWIATRYAGLVKHIPESKKEKSSTKTVYLNGKTLLKSINSINGNKEGEILVGTTNGLYLISTSADRTHIVQQIPLLFDTEQNSRNIRNTYLDLEKFLWVTIENQGTYRSTTPFDKTAASTHMTEIHVADELSICANDILQTNPKDIWLALIGKGIAHYNTQTKQTRLLPQMDIYVQLHAVSCHNIVQDQQQNLWVSSDIGLFNLQISKTTEPRIYKFDKTDGLPADVYAANCLKKLTNEKIIIAGDNKICIFNPNDLQLSTHTPNVILSNNQQLDIRQNTDKKNQLAHNNNNITFSFSSTDYQQPQKNYFAYKIKGATNWKYVDAYQRSATLLNLPAGKYTFIINTMNHHGVWSPTPTKLSFSVKQHPLRTPIAYLIYFCLLVGIAYVMLYMRYRNIVTRKTLELEKINHEKQSALFRYKMDFFTNLSHELLTPLSIINTTIHQWEKLMASDNINIKNIIHNNSQALYQKISKILYFRRVESGEMRLHLKQENLAQIVRNTVNNFQPIAIEKNIQLIVNCPANFYGLFDADKISMMLDNLITNALKYTDKGSVTLNIFSTVEQGKTYANIEVKDTGCGMSQTKLNELLNLIQTFQTTTGGSGIGLKLVGSLIRMHYGKIQATTQTGQGSQFSLIIPISLNEYDQIEQVEEQPIIEENTTEEIISTEQKNDHIEPRIDKHILLINKNTDYLTLNKYLFTEYYTTHVVTGPQEAIQILETEQIDLIVSDYNFDDMSGIQLCENIRTTSKYHDIPFILLIPAEEQNLRAQGYGKGVDSILIKPVEFNTLLLRINSLLTRYKKIKSELLTTSKIKISTLDEQFIKQIKENIEREISNPELNIEMLAQNIGMSHSSLYRKCKSVLGLSLNEYIRSMRMDRAAQILRQDTKITVAEVANMVGYYDNSYFGVSFKKQFNITPKEYQSKQQDPQ